VLGMSDRILVLHEGRVSGEFDRAEATEENILNCAMRGSAAEPLASGRVSAVPS